MQAQKCFIVSCFRDGERVTNVVTSSDKFETAINYASQQFGIDQQTLSECTVDREDFSSTQYQLSYMRYGDEIMLVQIEDVNLL